MGWYLLRIKRYHDCALASASVGARVHATLAFLCPTIRRFADVRFMILSYNEISPLTKGNGADE